MQESKFQIITFYEFKTLAPERLALLRTSLHGAMKANSIKGTVILAEEGFNSTVCGEPKAIVNFVEAVEAMLETKLTCKSSFHSDCPFRKIDVKIKAEIVTLNKRV